MHTYNSTLSFILVMLVFCAVPSSAKSTVRLVSQRGGETVLCFQVSGYEIKKGVINGEECSYVAVPEICNAREKGCPQLPQFAQSIIIPDNAEMGLEIVDVQYVEMKISRIIPSRGVIFRNQDPASIPYTFGDVYQKDLWYPESLAEAGRPYILRDVRGLAVRFSPFQYNPVKGILRIARTITVKVKEIGPGTINVLNSRSSNISPAFLTTYKNHFINHSSIVPRYTPVPDGDKMVVITHPTFKNDIAPFVAWKNQKGIRTTVYEYPSQTGGPGWKALKSFIQNKYDSEKITYILLVGDAPMLPSTDSSAAGGTDPTLTLLNGSDKYPDAFIGRFSVSTSEEAAIIVNKVLKYEKEPKGDWYTRATGIASNEGSPPDWEWMENVRKVLMGYNYKSVDQLYDRETYVTAQDIKNAFNAGRGFVSYMGHGGQWDWFTGYFVCKNVDSLTNYDMLPVVVSVACSNGGFDFLINKDCFAEVFLQSKGGAIAFFGSKIPQAWDPPQIAHKEIVDILCKDLYISVGGILYNGECKMLDAGDDQSTFINWILFGDPTLQMFTNTPAVVNVTHPASVSKGQQKVTLTFGAAIDGRVSLYEGATGLLGTAIVDNATSAVIDATIPNVQKITLTVTARNMSPYIAEIPVEGAAITQNGDQDDKLFQCIPNSTGTLVKFIFANPTKHTLVTIYSGSGRTMASEITAENRFSWNTSELTSGIYFVNLKADGKVLKKRICLMK